MVRYIAAIPIYNPTRKGQRPKMRDVLTGLLSVVKVCRSPEHTVPGCVSASDTFDDAGVGARHCLHGRDPVHSVSDAQEGTEHETTRTLDLIILPLDRPCSQIS